MILSSTGSQKNQALLKDRITAMKIVFKNIILNAMLILTTKVCAQRIDQYSAAQQIIEEILIQCHFLNYCLLIIIFINMTDSDLVKNLIYMNIFFQKEMYC